MRERESSERENNRLKKLKFSSIEINPGKIVKVVMTLEGVCPPQRSVINQYERRTV